MTETQTAPKALDFAMCLKHAFDAGARRECWVHYVPDHTAYDRILACLHPTSATLADETLRAEVERMWIKLRETQYLLNFRDCSLIGLPYPDDGMKVCTGLSLEKITAAKRLRDIGLVTIEDSPNGPLVSWTKLAALATAPSVPDGRTEEVEK